MSSAVDILEERVAAAVDLIARLRLKVESLERELATTRVKNVAPIEELERLRAERAVVRERIRGLLREIDRVSW